MEIRIAGNIEQSRENAATILYDNFHLRFPDFRNLYSFTEEAKGASKEKLYILSDKYNLDRNFRDAILGKGPIEIGLFKAVLLIYGWIETALTDPDVSSMNEKIHDDFIIDVNYNSIPQNDIYFIKSSYLNGAYDMQLEKLVDLNLLAVASVSSVAGNFNTYFTPLVAPGASRENFTSESDKSGMKTYSLWREILNDKHNRISSWHNNRF
ncbi:hypothetical protein MKQ70_16515 [Chitinophaga sedimenti]|uniref:hypothetical protein n=1 Tax=Chitinophaga sedimenti TaxID=2033606 RepID=UPI0020031735|nr:hypothetical protein [Chitinophaga sedimenti]MCK7556532.1 hypothetical protein [Chitinophaga sedimenti]